MLIRGTKNQNSRTKSNEQRETYFWCIKRASRTTKNAVFQGNERVMQNYTQKPRTMSYAVPGTWGVGSLKLRNFRTQKDHIGTNETRHNVPGARWRIMVVVRLLVSYIWYPIFDSSRLKFGGPVCDSRCWIDTEAWQRFRFT